MCCKQIKEIFCMYENMPRDDVAFVLPEEYYYIENVKENSF